MPAQNPACYQQSALKYSAPLSLEGSEIEAASHFLLFLLSQKAKFEFHNNAL